MTKRILHFGVGNFHRAHQAWYTQRAELHDPGWSITGLSFRSPEIRDAMAAQDNTYTLVTHEPEGPQFTLLAVHEDILFVPDATSRVMELISDPDTHIITLTVTEKGYHFAADGTLDLAALEIPLQTPLGLLAHGLAERSAPITILSCDNLPENGSRLRAALGAYASHAGLTITARLSCPNTMVDRIVPATTDALRDHVAEQSRTRDAAPVETESFSEWVIEDDFAGPRPAWDLVGVQIVDDIHPYELRKLRLLNGAHSFLAYCGIDAGHEFVHEAIADPDVNYAIRVLMEEACSTLPDGIETDAYCAALLDRFANPALQHKLRQIAMDGTLKLPIRILPVIAERKEMGFDSPAATLALAGWLKFLRAEVAAGREIEDPQAEQLTKAVQSGGDRELLGLLGIKAQAEQATG